jgi:hypothetical protein
LVVSLFWSYDINGTLIYLWSTVCGTSLGER